MGLSQLFHTGFCAALGLGQLLHTGFCAALRLGQLSHTGLCPALGLGQLSHTGFSPALGLSQAAHNLFQFIEITGLDQIGVGVVDGFGQDGGLLWRKDTGKTPGHIFDLYCHSGYPPERK